MKVRSYRNYLKTNTHDCNNSYFLSLKKFNFEWKMSEENYNLKTQITFVKDNSNSISYLLYFSEK